MRASQLISPRMARGVALPVLTLLAGLLVIPSQEVEPVGPVPEALFVSIELGRDYNLERRMTSRHSLSLTGLVLFALSGCDQSFSIPSGGVGAVTPENMNGRWSGVLGGTTVVSLLLTESPGPARTITGSGTLSRGGCSRIGGIPGAHWRIPPPAPYFVAASVLAGARVGAEVALFAYGTRG